MKHIISLLVGCVIVINVYAQEKVKTKYDFYGQLMTDAGYNTGQVNPDYFDVMRPTQLPAWENQYGTD